MGMYGGSSLPVELVQACLMPLYARDGTDLVISVQKAS